MGGVPALDTAITAAYVACETGRCEEARSAIADVFADIQRTAADHVVRGARPRLLMARRYQPVAG